MSHLCNQCVFDATKYLCVHTEHNAIEPRYKKYYLTCSKWWYLISLVLLGESIERKRKINENSCTVVPRPMRILIAVLSNQLVYFSFIFTRTVHCADAKMNNPKKAITLYRWSCCSNVPVVSIRSIASNSLYISWQNAVVAGCTVLLYRCSNLSLLSCAQYNNSMA